MNNFFLYEYPDTRLQFLSTANPVILAVMSEINPKPKLIGIWKFKNVKLPANENSNFKS